MDLVDGGGPFVFWIFMNGVVLWTLVIERLWYFSRVLPRETREMLARWNARPDKETWASRQICAEGSAEAIGRPLRKSGG